MTPRERLLRRLAGQPVDKVPNLDILMAFAARHVGRGLGAFCQDWRVLVEANLRCNERFGIDLLNTMSDPFRETYDLGARIRFREDENPVCEEPLVKGPEDVAKLRHFDPLDSTRMLDRIRAVEAYRREAGDHWAILGWVEGPLAEAADLRGVSEILMDMYTEPGLVRDLMAFCRDGAIRCARAQLAAGADLIGIGDAVASLVPPDFYAEQLVPLERDLVDAVHAAGGKVKLHICGNIAHLLDHVGKTGADIIDIDWMVDLATAAEKVGPGSAVNGNFDPVTVLLQGTPAVVRAAVRTCLAQGGPRACISAGCEVPRDTPPENLAAVDEALREAGAA